MSSVVDQEESGSPPQEKAAIRNKRKFRAESPAGELGQFGLEYPLTADCVGFEVMSPEKAAAEGVNLDVTPSACDACKRLHVTAEELLGCRRRVNWGYPDEAQLEEILLKSLDTTFDNAVSLITAMGYSEPAARAAVARAATRYSWKESLAGFSEVAVEVVKTEEAILPRNGVSLEDLRKMERAVLRAMIALVKDGEGQSFYTLGDVMFCLLMSDMSVANACAMDYSTASLPAVGAQVIAQPVVGNYKPGASSDISIAFTNPQMGVSFRGKLAQVPPSSYNGLKADSSSTPAVPNVSSGKPSVSGKMHSVIPNPKPEEHPIGITDHSEEQPFVAAATHSVKDDKPCSTKRGSSKRDSLHWQKMMSFDKNSRAVGSKGSLKSNKHSCSGSTSLDRKCRPLPDSATSSLKGSSKVGKGYAASMAGSEYPADLSVHATGNLVTAPSFDAKTTNNADPASAASTELSLSLPSSSDTSAHDSKTEAIDPRSKINFSFDEDKKVWIPQDKKDEMVLILVHKQKELQAHMRDWSAWAMEKVRQVTRRLAKEKEELHSLRKEKEDAERLQKERYNLKESTRKKLLEMDSAILRVNNQLEKADASVRRRESEITQLRIQMEAAKRHAEESAAHLVELLKKDENGLKRSLHWESERALLQEELAAQKSKLSRVQQQLKNAKQQKDQLKARHRQEEARKIEAVACVASERKERDQIETSLRSKENLLHLKSVNDMQRYKSEVRALEQQITQLEISLDSSEVAAPNWGTDDKPHANSSSSGQVLAKLTAAQMIDLIDIQRDRECVMCLNEEMSVVFLPCAHQVVCAKCNDLHIKQGMKDCPSCRTPIQRRVCARRVGC